MEDLGRSHKAGPPTYRQNWNRTSMMNHGILRRPILRNPFWWKFGLACWHVPLVYFWLLTRGGLDLGRRLPMAGKGLSRDMYSVAFLIVAWWKKLASLNPMRSRGTITHAMKWDSKVLPLYSAKQIVGTYSGSSKVRKSPTVRMLIKETIAYAAGWG